MINEIVVIGDLSMREGVSMDEYNKVLGKMYKIVSAMPGFQSVKKYTAEDGETVSLYRFESEAALEAWRTQPDHVAAMKRGHAEFYAEGHLQICKVIREVGFKKS